MIARASAVVAVILFASGDAIAPARAVSSLAGAQRV